LEFTTPGIEPIRYWEAIVINKLIIRKLTAPERLKMSLTPLIENIKALNREGDKKYKFLNILVIQYTNVKNKNTFIQSRNKVLTTLT